MNPNSNQTGVVTGSSQPIQTNLLFEGAENEKRIAEARKPQCVALISELIEIVVQSPQAQDGGAND